MLVCLHFFQIVVLFDLINLLPMKSDNSRGQNFAIIALCSIPIFLILSFVVKKSDLKKMYYSPLDIKRGNFFLIIYIVVLIVSIPIIVFIKQGHL